MATAARAPSDGYTILLASSSIVVNPNLYASMPFDVEKDFIPVTKVGRLAELLGGQQRFSGQDDEGVDRFGEGQSGQVQRCFAGKRHHAVAGDRDAQAGLRPQLRHRAVCRRRAHGAIAARRLHADQLQRARRRRLAFIQAGKVRALAVTSKQRLETLPDVPTLDELGIKDEESETMAGVFVPAGTPQPIVDLLQKEIAAIVRIARREKAPAWRSRPYRTAISRPTSPLT